MYLYPSPDGVWQFQIYIPSYMRHMFGGKRLYRKSTGTRDIYKARHFRNHMLVEWNNLKEQFKPDTNANNQYIAMIIKVSRLCVLEIRVDKFYIVSFDVFQRE